MFLLIANELFVLSQNHYVGSSDSSFAIRGKFLENFFTPRKFDVYQNVLYIYIYLCVCVCVCVCVSVNEIRFVTDGA